MTRGCIAFLSLLCGFAAASAGQPAGHAEASKPNVLVILADDLGYADVGFHGSREIPTPHIDRIAAEGVVFPQGYVSGAVCAPSRAGLITGRYQDRFGSSRNPTVNPNVPNGVPRSERMISELLKPAGYRTMAVGKWHMGTFPGLHPQDRGFDESFGLLEGGCDYFADNLTLNDFSEVTTDWGWYKIKLRRNGVPVSSTGYVTDLFSDAAADFIRRQTPDTPFFLYLAYNAPHGPLQATEAGLARFAHIEDPRRRTYAAMVAAMDDGIGRVLAALDETGAAQRTIVFFLSDNGGPIADNASNNAPLRGRKGDAWEGALRVPFALRWPGVVTPGTVYEHPIIALDICATVVAAAGPEARAALLPDKPLDGVDLAPFLTQATSVPPHDALYWRWFDDDRYAVRDSRHKLIVSRDGAGPRGLFDLSADIAERTDLLRAPSPSPEAEAEAEAEAERLTALAEAWMRDLVPPAYPPLSGRWRPGK